VTMKYNKYISLGADCQAAHYIRKHRNQEEAYPFDWLITPVPALLKLVEFGPESLFFDKSQFWAKDENGRSHATVTHKGLEVVFFHDFPAGPKALNAYDQVVLKFRHLSQRWHSLAQIRGRMLFIRHYATKDESLQIQKAIRQAFPNMHFDLLVVNEGEADNASWNLPEIINVSVGATTTPWTGDSDGWANVFKTMC
jgi:hypothetical protein